LPTIDPTQKTRTRPTSTTEIHHEKPGTPIKKETENVDMNLKMRQPKIPQDLSGRGGENLMEGTMNFFSRPPVAPRLPNVANFFLTGLARLMTEELRVTRS
jgi:hypothetical protein